MNKKLKYSFSEVEDLLQNQKEMLDDEFASRMEEIIKEIEGYKCKVPKQEIIDQSLNLENINKIVLYAGRFNYNKAIDDILKVLKEK